MIPKFSPITINSMIFAGSVLTFRQYVMPYLSNEPTQTTLKEDDHKKDYIGTNHSNNTTNTLEDLEAARREADDARERESRARAREELARRDAEAAAKREELAKAREEKAKQDANEQRERAEDAESKLVAGCMAEKTEISCKLSLTEVDKFLNSEASRNAPLEKFIELLKDLEDLKGDECIPLYQQALFSAGIANRGPCFQNKECQKQALSLLKTKKSQIKN